MCLLKVAALSVSKSGHALLDKLSMQVRTGEIHVIIGPNGAGKSTLINTLAGDTSHYSGAIELANKNLKDACDQRPRLLATLPQMSLLNFPYSVKDVVALGRTPHDTGLTIDARVVSEVMEAMDIIELAEAKYTQLSGGEKQRTQLARVLAQIWRKEDAPQRLLLLDEPFSALDIGHQQALIQTIERFASTGVAVLLVVHDMNIAAKLAHNIIVLSQGRVAARGKPAEVLKTDILKDVFNADLRVVSHPDTEQPFVML